MTVATEDYPLCDGGVILSQQHVSIDTAHPKRACATTIPHTINLHECILSGHAANDVVIFQPITHCGLNVRI